MLRDWEALWDFLIAALDKISGLSSLKWEVVSNHPPDGNGAENRGIGWSWVIEPPSSSSINAESEVVVVNSDNGRTYWFNSMNSLNLKFVSRMFIDSHISLVQNIARWRAHSTRWREYATCILYPCTKSCTSEDGTQASLPNGIQLSCVVPEQVGLRVTKLGQRSRGV